jgi:hypothetical protein
MSEELADETRRLAVEAAVFKRLDKRREENSASYAMRQVARDEQNAETLELLVHILLNSYLFRPESFRIIFNSQIYDKCPPKNNYSHLTTYIEDFKALGSRIRP